MEHFFVSVPRPGVFIYGSGGHIWLDKSDMALSIYRGFSSSGGTWPPRAGVYDKELVKEDLLNLLNVSFREVPGRPGFGSGFRAALSEPFDEVTEQWVRREAERVFSYDPRLELISLDVQFDRTAHSITIIAEVLYVELFISDTLALTVKQ